MPKFSGLLLSGGGSAAVACVTVVGAAIWLRPPLADLWLALGGALAASLAPVLVYGLCKYQERRR